MTSPNNSQSILALNSIQVAYRNRIVISLASFKIWPGEIVALLGKNGAGKSTLMKCIVGILNPVFGSIHINDTDVTSFSTTDRQKMGLTYLWQGGRIFPNLSCTDNVLIASKMKHRAACKISAQSLRLGWLYSSLQGREHMKAGDLSGGLRQMLAIELALLQLPAIMLLDEPTASLSPESASYTMRAIREYTEETKCGVLLVDQNTDNAFAASDRVLVLDSGQLSEKKLSGVAT